MVRIPNNYYSKYLLIIYDKFLYCGINRNLHELCIKCCSVRCDLSITLCLQYRNMIMLYFDNRFVSTSGLHVDSTQLFEHKFYRTTMSLITSVTSNWPIHHFHFPGGSIGRIHCKIDHCRFQTFQHFCFAVDRVEELKQIATCKRY